MDFVSVTIFTRRGWGVGVAVGRNTVTKHNPVGVLDVCIHNYKEWAGNVRVVVVEVKRMEQLRAPGD